MTLPGRPWAEVQPYGVTLHLSLSGLGPHSLDAYEVTLNGLRGYACASSLGVQLARLEGACLPLREGGWEYYGIDTNGKIWAHETRLWRTPSEKVAFYRSALEATRGTPLEAVWLERLGG